MMPGYCRAVFTRKRTYSTGTDIPGRTRPAMKGKERTREIRGGSRSLDYDCHRCSSQDYLPLRTVLSTLPT